MKFPIWPLQREINKIDLGLDRMHKLLYLLGNPERKIPPIFHIAGTNGKGSTSAFLKYILEESGYKVHRYISPHLVRFNERIEIDGNEITDEYYYELAEECRSIIEKNNLYITYFEIITTIAFMAFARNIGDATILEVGMGGRLDATNVINNPFVSIIMPISLDHTNVLGDTVEKIAMEKFGIVKKNHPVIISEQLDSVKNLFIESCKKLGSESFICGKDWTYKKYDDKCLFEGFSKNIETPLPKLEGTHQIINAGTAIAALACQNQLKISDINYSNGVKNAFWKGRLQNLTNSNLKKYLEVGSELYIDGGHNEDGARVIRDWIKLKNEEKQMDNVLIICMLARKDIKTYIGILAPMFSNIIVVSNKNNEYLDSGSFTKLFQESGFLVDGNCVGIIEALNLIKGIKTNNKKRILACGSLYFCGEILEITENLTNE